MTERLRDVFDEMLAGEPPLAINADTAADAGRRRMRRNRNSALWSALGAMLVVSAVVTLPQAIRAGGLGSAAGTSSAATPSGSASLPPSSVPAPHDSGLPTTGRMRETLPIMCSSAATPYSTDGSVLPDPERAAAAVIAAGTSTIAPLETFTLRAAERSIGQGYYKQTTLSEFPVVTLIFDVGDPTRGYGSIQMQFVPQQAASVESRAVAPFSDGCDEVWRFDFDDGSVSLNYPPGPPADRSDAVHLWYYSVEGFEIIVDMYPLPWGWYGVADPEKILSARGDMPVSIGGLGLLADVAARA